mmetsp:Transcript_13443/g.57334  ORF Transcript_13443/g.57334 Transcript_13443/m.57334 type:complete len:413 (-) Transcript_13443:545-1783(-)
MCIVAATASMISEDAFGKGRRGCITLCAVAASSSRRTSKSSSEVSAHDELTTIQASSNAAIGAEEDDDAADAESSTGAPSAPSKGGSEEASVSDCVTTGAGASVTLDPPNSTTCSGDTAEQSRRNTCEDNTISLYRNHCGSAAHSLLRRGGARANATHPGCKPALSSTLVRITPKCACCRLDARFPGSPVSNTATVNGSFELWRFTSASGLSSRLRPPPYAKSDVGTKPVRTSSFRSCARKLVRVCRPWMDKKLSRAQRHAASNPSSAIIKRHSWYARSTAKWSDESQKFRRAACASSRMPVGTMNGSREDMHAAAVSTGSKHFVVTPTTNMRPVAGSSGSCESNDPRGVKTSTSFDATSSTSAIAPSVLSRSIAICTVSVAGGSMASLKKLCTPFVVMEHVCKHVASSAVR